VIIRAAFSNFWRKMRILANSFAIARTLSKLQLGPSSPLLSPCDRKLPLSPSWISDYHFVPSVDDNRCATVNLGMIRPTKAIASIAFEDRRCFSSRGRARQMERTIGPPKKGSGGKGDDWERREGRDKFIGSALMRAPAWLNGRR